MRVLWIIPARAGSQGIAHKNVKELGGHPLLAWRISSALAIAAAEDVWVSTDSAEYAAIAEPYGATVPGLRPAELATALAGSAAVVQHAMDLATERGAAYDAVGLLQPTSPFVRPESLRGAVEALQASTEADGLVATRQVRPSTFYVQPETPYLDVIARRLAEKAGVPRRQDELLEVAPSGGIYLARWQGFRRHGGFYTEKTLGYRLTDLEAVDVDEQLDWDWADFLVRSGRIDPRDFGFLSAGRGG